MEQAKFLKEMYLALGVGGLSFIVILCILGYLLRNIYPLLQNIMQMMEVLKEVLQNNNKAIDEMARSNQNVASALKLLEKSLNSVDDKVDTVLITQDNIEKDIVRIKERLPIKGD